jgi:alkanesulfonate monooxygenase SsuD/methylene tetrahydromethanopterin reductase-like flavin-dependent oxidoreductase (luciferase family)
MDAAVHLPLIDFGGEGFSYRRLTETVDAARACGFGAVSANDHFVFSRPWLDGLTALAAVVERSGGMKLVTTVALAALRGPAPVAKALSALDVLSDGRVIAGVGPGSSQADYDLVGVPFEQRWQRFDDTLQLIKAMLQPATAASGASDTAAAGSLLPPPRQSGGIPVWIGSWGSRAGMRRVARAGDGWLASAYNTTPEAFTAAMAVLGGELESQQRPSGDFPNALVTMWAWITGSRSEADRVLSEIIAPLVRRDPAELRGRICVGSAGECAELLSRYARAGCQRVHFWPVGDERRQIELIAGQVMPQVSCLVTRGCRPLRPGIPARPREVEVLRLAAAAR